MGRIAADSSGWFKELTGGTVKFCILLGVLGFALALRSYCLHGLWGTDDGEYALLANAMMHGNFTAFVEDNYVQHFNAPAHLRFRTALIVPLSMLFGVFGISEQTVLLYPFVISELGVLVAFFCGRLLFGVNAGLISAAIWAVLPRDIRLATQFLPDGIASFYASVGVLMILYARLKGEQPLTRFFVGCLAGILFGISWLTKESIVYLIPFCAILLWWDMRENLKSAVPLWIGVAITSGGIFLVEMITYYISSGDPLLRMHENQRSFVQTQSYLFYEGSRFGWPVGGSHIKALIKRLFMDGPSVIFLNLQSLFLPSLGLVALAHALYWKDKSFLIPAMWMATLIGMYNFASVSLSSYTPLVLNERYLHPVMLPATVLTAGLIAKLTMAARLQMGHTANGERVFWGWVVSWLVVSSALYANFREVQDVPVHASIYNTRDVAGLIKPSEKVYTDPLSAKALQFFWGYPSDMRTVNYEGMRTADVEPNSAVLVDTFRLDWLRVNVSMWLTSEYGYHAPEFSEKAPESWKIVWRDRNATLYRVPARNVE